MITPGTAWTDTAGRRLQAHGAGAKVQLWTCNGGANQRWNRA